MLRTCVIAADERALSEVEARGPTYRVETCELGTRILAIRVAEV